MRRDLVHFLPIFLAALSTLCAVMRKVLVLQIVFALKVHASLLPVA